MVLWKGNDDFQFSMASGKPPTGCCDGLYATRRFRYSQDWSCSGIDGVERVLAVVFVLFTPRIGVTYCGRLPYQEPFISFNRYSETHL
jgi:hypothetical protein